MKRRSFFAVAVGAVLAPFGIGKATRVCDPIDVFTDDFDRADSSDMGPYWREDQQPCQVVEKPFDICLRLVKNDSGPIVVAYGSKAWCDSMSAEQGNHRYHWSGTPRLET